MPINSKQKGSEAERKLAKTLSEWANCEFHRTPASGALHWANDKRVVSDIVPSQELVDKGWPFSIENKKVENSWEFNGFIEGTSQTLKEHWEQCVTDSQREDMVPMLVFSKNYRDTYVMIKQSTFAELGIKPESYMTLHNQSYDLVILKLKDILSNITIEELLKINFSK